MIDSVIALSRRIRWWVMAKRCASSRTRWSSCSSGVSCGITTGVGLPGRKTSSIRLASETTATPRSRKPCSGSRPAPSWPLPPSMITRFGSAANDASRSASYGERSAWRLPLRVAARQDLRHRGEIIAGIDLANRETPVIALLRRAALEDHHRGDGVRAADVRDVEALDPHRQRVEAPAPACRPVSESTRCWRRRSALSFSWSSASRALRSRQVEDAALAAALGRADLDRPAAALGQQLAQHVRAPSPRPASPCDDDQRRDRERARVVLEHELLGDDRRLLLGLVLEVEGLAVATARRRGPGRPARWPRCPRRRRRPRRRCRRRPRPRAGARAAT